MTEDQDNAGEVVAATVRVALTAAGRLAEQAARRREAALRDAERTSASQVATLEGQLAVERQAALGSVRDVLRRSGTASVEDFAQAWQQILSWEDPVAAADRDSLRGAVRERFGVDPDALSGGGAPAASAQVGDRDRATATTTLATDSTGQREDARHRLLEAHDRAVHLAVYPEGAEIDADVAQARALAAQSHPTSPILAAQRPTVAPRPQARSAKRRADVEVQGPGR